MRKASIHIRAASAAALSCAFSQGWAQDALDVRVAVEGIEDKNLAKEMRAVASLERAEEDAFRSLGPVRRAAETDAAAIRQALVSKGYYAAAVDPAIRREADGVLVTFDVAPGARFEITEYEIDYQDPVTGRTTQERPRPNTLREAGIRANGSPEGERLREIETKLIQDLWSEGFPAASPEGRRVEADFATNTAKAVFPITSGPLARYGRIEIRHETEADTKVFTDDAFLESLADFETGEVYRRAEIDAYQEAIADTGLFRAIDVQPAPPGYEGTTDVLVTVSERPPRTVQGGVGYGTDVGPTVRASWEHRNLLGSAERLFARAAYSVPVQLAEVVFEKPRPNLPGSWQLGALLQNEDTDAFEAQSVLLTAALSKLWLDRDLETVAGVRYQFADITDQDGTERTFSSVSTPLSAIFNNETDELNPTDGFRARLVVEPFFGDTQFNKVSLGGATRVTFGRDDLITIAVRGRVGAAYGADREDIPATERYFAGGGGSVRGYGFQEAGPLNLVERDGGLVYADGRAFAFAADEDGNITDDPVVPVGPTGGASLAEGNLEGRYKVTDAIQAVAFVDTGTVFDSQTPDFSGDFFTGVGIGVRYLTPVGPLRVDVALPLERRKLEAERTFVEDGETVTETETLFQDDAFGLYIALGQPF